MSKRPITAKKLNRLRKALRRTPQGHINLIQYLKDRSYVNTSGGAKAMLVAGRVRVDSHVVGRKPDPLNPDEFVIDPLISAEYRDRIIVA